MLLHTHKTRRMRSPKVALLKIPMDSVQYNTEHCGINDDTDDEHSVYHMCQSPLCWFNEYVHIRVVVLQHSAYRNFSKVQVLVIKFCLFRAFYRCHFLHDFHTWGVTFKGKALATKCIFQNYSHLLDICTRLVLKTAEELIVPRVYMMLVPLAFTFGSSAYPCSPYIPHSVGWKYIPAGTAMNQSITLECWSLCSVVPCSEDEIWTARWDLCLHRCLGTFAEALMCIQNHMLAVGI